MASRYEGKGCTSEYAEAPEADQRCVLEPGHGMVLHFNRAGFAWDDAESAASARHAIGELRRARHVGHDTAALIAARALSDGLGDLPYPTFDRLADVARSVCPDGCPAQVLDEARSAYDRLLDELRRRLAHNPADTPEEARRG